jgi:hypothetical protein
MTDAADEEADAAGDDADAPTVRARVRGVYATALTRAFLDAGHDVVQASGAIRERFDADLPAADHDVAVSTTDDRQGVGVTGAAGDVDAATRVCRVARDTLAWPASAPRGAVFDAEVRETLGSGAVCDLGEAEGFLPFDAADGYVEAGDAVRVQVRAGAPPWADRRPELGTALRAEAGLATLVAGAEGVRVDTYDDEAGRELVGMTELLGVEPPDGWGLEWSHAATDADMDALRAAAERAVERADALADARGATVDDAPGPVAVPTATTWVWFGRESRFALDERRRAVTTTMPGHHRVKAAHEAASAGVDLVEALCDPGADGSGDEGDGTADFPFAVVARQFGPRTGDRVRIEHGKPDGRLVTLGTGEVVDLDADGTVAVRRGMTGGGTYDALGVAREAGDVALTKFREGRWWYPTVYRDADGARKGTYVNVCTPVEAFPDAVRYVDLHVDVVKHRDGRVERVDDDELDDAVAAGEVSEALAEQARAVASGLESAL